VAGEWKGRRLKYPDDAAIRPTTQRSKASLFETLGGRVPGAVFVDLYAGAGGVGIEALSRGAALVHFVEVARAAVSALRANLDTCRADLARYRIHVATVADALAGETGSLEDAEIVFADPPYDMDAEGDWLRGFDPSRWTSLEVLVVEHRTRVPVPSPAGLVVERARRFGDTTLTYFVRNMETDAKEG
jgi:16S rRNA (guanine966-N2)-methyltransferase